MSRKTRRRTRTGWLAALLLAMSGCQGLGGGTADTRDPFLGVNGSPSLPAGGPRATPLAAADRTAPVPPLPAPTSTTSPAALTTGSTGTLDGGRDLRIGQPPPEPGPWKGPHTTQPTVLLRQPEPVAPGPEPGAGTATYGPTFSGPGPGVALTSGPGPTPDGNPSDDYRQLQQLLKARGVVAQRLDTSGDGKWRFWCAYPIDPRKPLERQVIEVTADTDVAALRAALARIDTGR